MQHLFLFILGILFTTHYIETAGNDPYSHLTMLYGIGGMTVAITLLGRILCQWSMHGFRKMNSNPRRFILRLTRFQSIYTMSVFAAQFALLQYWNLGDYLTSLPLLAEWDVLLYACGMAPLISFYVLRWLTQVPFERMMQEDRWSQSAYLRFKCFPLLPVFPLLFFTLCADLSTFLPAPVLALFSNHVIPMLALMAVLSVTMVSFFPFLLKWIFGCHPLPPGTLRDDLEHLMKKSGVRCRDILVWPMRGMQVPNAMMTGILPGWRFVFLTDTLLERLQPLPLRGVFAHELGHGKHNHLIWLLCLVYVFLFFSTIALEVISTLLPQSTTVQIIVLLSLFALFWGGAFGYLMRRFERQADLYASRLTGSSFGIVTGLLTIRDMAERHRKLPSFFHFSIEDRVHFLHAADTVPEVEDVFQKTVRGLKFGLLATAIIFGLLHYPLHQSDILRIQVRDLYNEEQILEPKHYDEALDLRQDISRFCPFDLQNRFELGLLMLALAEENRQLDLLTAGISELKQVAEWAWDETLQTRTQQLLQQAEQLRTTLPHHSP